MSEEFRAARRTYIRQNHPDRGGDPAAFAEGLRLLDQQHHAAREQTETPVVLAYRSRRTAPARWVRRLRRRPRHRQRNLK